MLLLNKPGDYIIFELGQPSTLTLDFGWYTEIYKIELSNVFYNYFKGLDDKRLTQEILSWLFTNKLKATLVKEIGCYEKYTRE